LTRTSVHPRGGIWARSTSAVRPELPRWPLTVALAGYPFWWVLGIGDLIWPAMALAMAFYLVRFRRVDIPRSFGVWLIFVLLMLASAIGLDSFGRGVGFAYRASFYLSATVIFIYVFNARRQLTARYIAGVLTTFWLIVVAGGYLGVFFPLFSIRTPLAFVVPESFRNNELVLEMIVRRATQWDPSSALALDPRPSAPFLYTNSWGNAFSMLMPFVVAYLFEVRREKRFWWLVVAIPISLVPAVLTLNRGMFLGLGLAVTYVVFRFALKGNFRAVGLIGVLAMVGALVFVALPASERLTTRVTTSSTTEDRLDLYSETLDRVNESPIFGYGAPRPSERAGAPSAGTQGQFWLVLFSHGWPAVVAFTGWFFWAFLSTWRWRSATGAAANTAILVVSVEIFYYGIMANGLILAMIAAAFGMRGASEGESFERPLFRSVRDRFQASSHAPE
jgi:hypothetical protein